MRKMGALTFCLLAVATWSGRGNAEDARMTLEATPAGRPRPTLRYRLYPSILDQKEGNAAALYYRAIFEQEQARRLYSEEFENIANWTEMPADQLPREDVRKLLDRFDRIFTEANIGARRSRAHWDIPLREEGPGTILNEMQEFRSLARLFLLRAELALLDRNYEEASRCLQTALAMSRHVSESGTLISSLVGIASARISLNAVEQWIATPGSPNLYWALTALPDPLVDMSIGMQSEMIWMLPSIPFGDLLDKTILSTEQGRELAKSVVEMLESYGAEESAMSSETALMAIVMSAYPFVKRELIASGRKESEVEAMPAIQVFLLTNIKTFQEFMEEVVAWSGRPYWELQTVGGNLDQHMSEVSNRKDGYLVRLFAPSASSASASAVRLQRQLAMLRTVEAIRLFAADHKGRLPANLAEITEVPIPIDPVTNQPFHYRVEGNKGVLEGPKPNDQIGARVYEITLRPEKK